MYATALGLSTIFLVDMEKVGDRSHWPSFYDTFLKDPEKHTYEENILMSKTRDAAQDDGRRGGNATTDCRSGPFDLRSADGSGANSAESAPSNQWSHT